MAISANYNHQVIKTGFRQTRLLHFNTNLILKRVKMIYKLNFNPPHDYCFERERMEKGCKYEFVF